MLRIEDQGRGRRLGLQVFLAGFVLAFFALAPAFWPYGGRFVVRGDYIEQQIPFLLETRRLLLSGTPFWSWNTLLGSNFLGNYAFYTVGSPFVWILLPLPEAALPYGITVAALLKQAVAAWTAYLFLRRFVSNPRFAQLGGLLYAFCGFTIINTQFYHFADIIAVFPLLPLALESLFSERPRYGALAGACALNTLVNYYFMVGTALFMLLYGLARFFSNDWKPYRRFSRVFFAFFEAGLGCLLPAFLLFPAAWAMLGISRTGRFMMFDFTAQYSLWDMLERLRVLFMPIESSSQHAFYGSAANWASVAVFLPLVGMVPILMSLRKQPLKWSHILFLVLLVVSMIMPLNRLFVLGSNNTYTRWWYGLALLMCLITVQALDSYHPALKSDRRSALFGVLFSLGITTLFTLPFLLPTSWLDSLRDRGGVLGGFASGILSQQEVAGYAGTLFRVFCLGAWALNLLLCFIALRPRVFVQGKVVLGLLCVCVVVNYGGFLILNNQFQQSGAQVGFVTGLDYYVQHELDDNKPVFSGTTYTHRVDFPPKILNYGMLINQPSISNFHSIRSSYLDEFLLINHFAFSELPYALPPDQQDGALRTFLGVKYYYNYDEENYPGAPEDFVYIGQEGDVSVYENPHALPLGFAYTHYTTHYYTSLNTDELSAIMLNAVVLDYKTVGPFEDWMDPVDPARLLSWQDAAAERAAMACYDLEMTPRGLTAKIDLDQQRLVGFTVPYDKGWRATINGEAAPVYQINSAFLGVIAPAGEALEIRLDFRPRGLREGGVVSLCALVILMAYLLWRRRPSARIH